MTRPVNLGHESEDYKKVEDVFISSNRWDSTPQDENDFLAILQKDLTKNIVSSTVWEWRITTIQKVQRNYAGLAPRAITYGGDREYFWTKNNSSTAVNILLALQKLWYPHLRSHLHPMIAKPRIRSEHCIGLLKGRFPYLKRIRIVIRHRKDMIRINRIIIRAAVLHNLMLNEDFRKNTIDIGFSVQKFWTQLHYFELAVPSSNLLSPTYLKTFHHSSAFSVDDVSQCFRSWGWRL